MSCFATHRGYWQRLLAEVTGRGYWQRLLAEVTGIATVPGSCKHPRDTKTASSASRHSVSAAVGGTASQGTFKALTVLFFKNIREINTLC